MGDATELCFAPAIELRRLLQAGDLSAVELVEAQLRRIERLNPLLNAYLTVTADAAQEQARAAEARAMRGEAHGPLDGLPHALKDLTGFHPGPTRCIGRTWHGGSEPLVAGTHEVR